MAHMLLISHAFRRISRHVAWLTLAGSLASFATTAPVTADPDTSITPDLRKYCTNIAATATDARFAWQTNKLKELEERVKARIKDLDAKETEIRTWMDRKAAIDKEASAKLVGIYAKMQPEIAANQISSLDDEMAAAVLSQLNPRQASAIFNEIIPERAAKLAGMIASGPATDDKKL